MIAINLQQLHFSEKFWDSPNEFRPERFLDESGTCIVNTNKIFAFGYGNSIQILYINYLLFISIYL